MRQFYCLITIAVAFLARIKAFQAGTYQPQHHLATSRGLASQSTSLFLADGSSEDADIVARRITVKGDVQGGYYRSCVANEVSY